MRTVKVRAKVKEDNTGASIEIPILLDENQQVLQPLLEYTLKLQKDGKSLSTISKCVDATKLLLEYMCANVNGFATPEIMFANFTSRLYIGTIDEDGIDESGLYWLPYGNGVTKLHIDALTKLTDWLMEKHGAISLNPLVETDNFTKRLNYAAWFRKNQHDFLGHIKNKHIHTTARYARSIQGKKPLGKSAQEAIEFPEHHFKAFYHKGIGGEIDLRAVLRDQLILLLMHGGGLRKSETLHLWLEDVSIDPSEPNSAKVQIYHPEDGKAPHDWRGQSGKMTRAAYLKEKYALNPRIRSMGKKHIGWKNCVFESKDRYINVYWFPTMYGETFLKLWQIYTRFLTQIKRQHPYAFVSFHSKHMGDPYTLNAFDFNYGQALRRIGLRPNKAEGLSPHSHRHSYARRLMRAGVSELIIKKCLHHASIDSQIVYTTPTINEVNACLKDATQRLLTSSTPTDRIDTPNWDDLVQYGYKDIDPKGLFSGKHPKLGRQDVY